MTSQTRALLQSGTAVGVLALIEPKFWPFHSCNMCLLTSNESACEHSDCRPMAGGLGEGVAPAVYMGMHQLNQMLVTLVGQNATMQEYLERLALRTRETLKGPKCFDPTQVDTTVYKLQLSPAADLPQQVFRERGFSLTFQLTASDGTPRTVPRLRFKLSLYTQETPPRRLHRNIAGKKVLRGSLEAESSSTGLVSFKNIVINEVSSHYLGDGFYLAVLSGSQVAVRPFVLRDFSVKARKPVKHSAS